MKSKWVAVLLIASLALNLALVGFVVGRASFAGPHASPAFDPTRAFPRWAKTLPNPRREELRPMIRAHFQAMRPQMQQMRNAQRGVNQAMTTNPFDPQQLQAALVHMRNVQNTTYAGADESFARFVGQLTPDERETLASRGQQMKRLGHMRRQQQHTRGKFVGNSIDKAAQTAQDKATQDPR